MKTLYSIIILISISNPLFAGGYNKGGHGFGIYGFVFEEALDLSDEQRAQIQAIKKEAKARKHSYSNANTSRKPLVFALNPDNNDYMQQVRDLAEQRAEKVKHRVLTQADMHAKIFALLSPTQKEKMLALAKKIEHKSTSKKHHKHW